MSGVPISIGNTTSETTVNDNLTVTGNLTVGGTTTISSFSFSNSTLVINKNQTASYDAGFLIQRYQTSNQAGLGDVVSPAETPIETGTAQSGTSNTIVLSNSANSNDNYYNNWWIKITGGTTFNDVRQIVSYVGSTRTATISGTFTSAPDNTSTYSLYNKNYVGMYIVESSNIMVLGSSVSNFVNSTITQFTEPYIVNCKGLAINDTPNTALSTNYALELQNSSAYKARAYSWDTYSSRGFKKDIAPLMVEECKDILDRLEPVKYKWRDEYGDHGEEQQYGLIAEEVRNILPCAVSEDARSIDYTKLIPLLLAQYKDLLNKYNELSERLDG